MSTLFQHEPEWAVSTFRCRAHLVRATEGVDPMDVLALDLSQRQLSVLPSDALAPFMRLTALHVSGNACRDAHVLGAGLDGFPLTSLDVSSNQVRPRFPRVVGGVTVKFACASIGLDCLGQL